MRSITEKISGYIDDKKEEIINFLSEFISFRSVNPGVSGKGEELEVQTWLCGQFTKFGFDKVDCWSVDSKGKRPNVVGIIKGKEGKKSLIFNGHCDVVPVTDKELEKWSTDPWKATIKNGMIYGRGAGDMKGGLAALIWAAKVIIDNEIDLKGDLFVESVVGEESGEGQTIGAQAAINRGCKAPFAVVGEPTNCEIKIRSPGIFFFELIIPGKEAHICDRNKVIFPQRHAVSSGSKVGVDAITKSIPFIQLFQRIELQWNQRWQDALLSEEDGVGSFTISLCYIEGGTYGASVIPGYCKMVYNVRYPNWLKDEDIWKELREHVTALASTDDWLRENPPQFNVPVIRRWQPMIETPVNHPGVERLAKVYEEITGKRVVISSFKGLADSTFLSRSGIPTVLFGPGGHNCGIHGPDERVPIDQLIQCTKIYAMMAIDWCKS